MRCGSHYRGWRYGWRLYEVVGGSWLLEVVGSVGVMIVELLDGGCGLGVFETGGWLVVVGSPPAGGCGRVVVVVARVVFFDEVVVVSDDSADSDDVVEDSVLDSDVVGSRLLVAAGLDVEVRVWLTWTRWLPGEFAPSTSPVASAATAANTVDSTTPATPRMA
ncbi:hypothetical protein [Actinokineospora iranica]|uniref:hypothetical protein n=1 Tax=Actinokineospora iranica TaxID=1271860 RepID=UPI0011138C23|nr:hypothetical protein [Actinokineospora iranica]